MPDAFICDAIRTPIGRYGGALENRTRLLRETLARQLTSEETAVVGRSPRALAPSEAAMFAVEAARASWR